MNPAIYADYRDKYPELAAGYGGKLPWVVEYDIGLPVAATYTLQVRYASPEGRLVEVWLDGRRVGTCCSRATGQAVNPWRNPKTAKWPPYPSERHGAEWVEGCEFEATAGKHTLRLTRDGVPPYVLALRLDSSAPFPKGWKAPEPKVELSRIPPRYRRAFMPPGSVNVATLRTAIEETIRTCGSRYPKGAEFLRRLAELEERQKAVQNGSPEEKHQVEEALKRLEREAMLAHPLLDFDRLLFVKRSVNSGHHIYGEYQNLDATGQLCILSPVAPDGEVTVVAPELDGGVFGQFDLSFDAEKIVFSYKKGKEAGFRIYEIGVDGTGLRQLTFDDDEPQLLERFKGSPYGHYDDVDPCYLPDGRIMFASTRSRRAVACFPTTVTSLYVMDPEGKNLRCLSGGQFTELDPFVMNDGRVVYMRWEYVDKGFGNVQSLWSVHPDGSYPDHVYKNNMVLPAGMVDARTVPEGGWIVTIGAPHCGPPVGPVILINTRMAPRSQDAMVNITPEIAYPGMFQITRGKGLFKQPYPLSRKLFLVSHNPQVTREDRFAIYVLDAWGNRAELYRDPRASCFQPVPLRPRPRPTVIPPVSAGTQEKARATATVFLQDVYEGMTGIERGRVKYIRVMEVLPTTWAEAARAARQGDTAGLQSAAVSYKADVGRKRVHGIATVHDDGSACFTVPAYKNIFFQALDENFMELQRMRTFINLMPGETRGCVGCHEPRTRTPEVKGAAAFRYPPQPLRPQPGDSGPRMVHYETDVQPIFNKHCVRCHSGDEPAGALDLTDERTTLWNRSYENLVDEGLVSYLNDGAGCSNVPFEPPLTFGSHRSGLVKRLLNSPCGAELSREEFIRIVTWIDANIPYYGTHRGKKNLKWKDEPDFRPAPQTTSLASK